MAFQKNTLLGVEGFGIDRLQDLSEEGNIRRRTWLQGTELVKESYRYGVLFLYLTKELIFIVYKICSRTRLSLPGAFGAAIRQTFEGELKRG